MSAPSDLAQVYLDRQQQRADDDTDREFSQLISAGVQQQQPATAGPVASAAPPGNDPATPAPSGFEHGPGPVARGVRDVGLGIAHSPSEALGGAVDAVHQEAKSVKDLGDWISSKLPESLRGGIAYTPGKGLHLAGGEEIDQLPGALEAITGLVPTTEGSGTVTGGMVRSIAQFVTGQAMLAATPAGALGEMGMAGRAASQALVGATAFDPQQRLSNLVQEVPALQNPVTEWLAAKPGDSDAKGRLKNAIEGLGLGAMTEGLTKALAATKAKIFARGAEEAAGDTGGAARQALLAADESRQALVAKVGEPTAPALEIRPPVVATEAAAAPSTVIADAVDAVPLPTAGAAPTDAAQQSGEISFKTSKGSTYKHFPDGTTVRDKAARPEHPGEQGVQPRSQRTWYVSQENTNKLGEVQAKGRPKTIEEVPSMPGHIAVRYLDDGKFERRTVVPFESAPRVGAYPVENWGRSKTIHFGNEITEVSPVTPAAATAAAPMAAPTTPPPRPPAPAQQASAAAADRPGEVYVNWARIQAPDDVKAMVQQLADARGGNISEAARGVRSWEATKLDAATKDAWQILQGRKSGQPLNAEESVAVRELWVRSAKRMVGLAKAVDGGGSEADQIAFRQALSVHNAIQEQVVAARTETARALGSWAIPAGEGADLAGHVQQLRVLAQSQAGTTAELAKGVMQLANAGKARELDAFLEAASTSTRADRVRQLWYSGLLSNPKTHVRNVVGNLSNLLLDIPETAMGEGSGVAKEKLFGLVQSYRDAWTILRRGSDVLQAEGPGLSPGLQEALSGSKLDPAAGGGAWAPERAGLTPDSAMGKVFSVIDSATTFQGRWLEQSDRVFKAMAWNMELRAGAYRQASEELAQGALGRAGFADRMADLMANPSESAKVSARAFAEAKTFQNQPLDTKLWQAAKAWHNVPLLGDITLPFLKTPYNVATQVMQRTPVAPFMKSWAADIAEGGTKAEMAWARFVMGNSILLTAADLTLSGHLTGQGPADPAAKATLARQGWKPWSVKIGDRYFDYRSVDPIGPALGLAAYAAETIAGRDYGDSSGFDRMQQVVTHTALGVGAQMMNQTFMTGMASFVDALSDPQRAGDSWINQFVTSAVVPRGIAQLERVLDPTQRAAYDVVTSVRAQIPGLSSGLPARRDLWGRPITTSSGLGWVYDMLSPVASSKEDAQPIDAELSRLGARLPMPDKKLSFQVLTPHGMGAATVDLWQHPEMYQRYLELAGQVVPERISGKPLMAALNDLVTGKHPLSGLYKRKSDGPEGGKADQIQELMRGVQGRARQQLLDEFPALKAEAGWRASQQPSRFNLQAQ